jgi:uncharacterized protein with HEPN domain
VTSLPLRQLACLLDIFKSVQAIQSYVAGQTREQFLSDAKTQDAVLRRFLVAGEAAARLTPATCDQFPSIPFGKIVGMRNRVIHDYGSVDFEIVWETIEIHLPLLYNELQQFFAERGEG